MRYVKFEIKNFKGIKDATVNLKTDGGASVFAFVGLNESGKTTILEAIHSFSPDTVTGELLGGVNGEGVPFKERVPRHLISSFTGECAIIATLAVEDVDRDKIVKILKSEHNIIIDPTSINGFVNFRQFQIYKDGDFVSDEFVLEERFKVKTGSQRKWRDPDEKETTTVRQVIYNLTPDIAYFPTFVFDFPERIYLTNCGERLDRFYRKVFQDILSFDGRGLTIQKDIIRRIRHDELKLPWSAFLTKFFQRDEPDKIQQVMDRVSAIVTNVVFGRWNEIFREAIGNKEVVVTYDTAEGKIIDGRGELVTSPRNEHDISVTFKIKDGTRRFNVNDRSLGFRWFFSFMLFTQFRTTESSSRPVLFLFDEPASNLHAAAQQKLIDCFPGIAKNGNVLAYTTHSHYMIEPKWLEQTFIVTNRSDAPGNKSVIDNAILPDESLDIKVTPYRSFVNQFPGQTDYFQPVLDRLQVIPSKFDWDRKSIVLEGKSDYYVIRYITRLFGFNDLPLIPGLGAGTFDSMIALSKGWNLQFLFVLDSDKQGEEEKKRYQEAFSLSGETLVMLGELLPAAKEIENLLDAAGKQVIQNELQIQTPPTKNQIRRFFQERLASDRVESLGSGFDSKAKTLVGALKARLENLE
ncbi:ATP-binding protein [Methylobacterium sp. E-065]|uniref:AAA family ATPase n=1 Tax=Methylobacterium sp. E-065 TaxID=2836583 RepID=UPI001FB94BAF|nr:AAA family ATPase [Methylobacterium sp. E-065]MCJ2018626.1 ATP-binding protein [Methylobacterium sp. E-065]